jgi:hypothetical protein
VIGKLVRKLLGIGLVMAGVCLIPGVWSLWADLSSGLFGKVGWSGIAKGTFFAAMFATGFVVVVIAIGCRLIVPGRPRGDAARKKKFAGLDEYF